MIPNSRSAVERYVRLQLQNVPFVLNPSAQGKSDRPKPPTPAMKFAESAQCGADFVRVEQVTVEKKCRSQVHGACEASCEAANIQTKEIRETPHSQFSKCVLSPPTLAHVFPQCFDIRRNAQFRQRNLGLIRDVVQRKTTF